jgi:hypothetical protein
MRWRGVMRAFGGPGIDKVDARALPASIVEVVGHSAGNAHEGASGRGTHRSPIRTLIVPSMASKMSSSGVEVSSGTFRVGLEPPLGDGVSTAGLLAVCLERSADSPH